MQSSIGQRTIPVRATVAAVAAVALLAAAWLGARANLEDERPSANMTENAAVDAGPVERTPWVMDRTEARWFVRHGVAPAELQAINRHHWNRLQVRLLADPAVAAEVRYHGVDLDAITRSYFNERA